ncbi:DUF1149 family protein [Enterococcus sp. 669A]|uniref:DUF1149 family protein n=1 Tax=Candidatus Enterococcus moelleringii TaxID=2815325 RepID=A0ABS3L792_9ENTE|nr:DUF1149 family protein [Enterococcus sp. 669A]MBO1305486.1 DUF1149 family protein [Enterococcus sp. 669A]
MEILRDKEIVEAFNYGLPPRDQEVNQKIQIGFSPLESTDPNYPKENSIMGVRFEFVLPFDAFIVSGTVSQVNHVVNRQIRNQSDMNETEANEMVKPLFRLVERMIYEITEIALDQPGIKINFASPTAQ